MIERFICSFNSLSKPARASIIFVVCSFIQKGISFCIVPIYTRIMDQTQYGYYSTFISWMSIIAVIATLNLSYHVYINGLIKYKDKRSEYTSSMLGLSFILTLGVSLVYALGHSFFNQILGFGTVYMIIMLVEILLQPAYDFWAAYQRFSYEYKKLSILALIQALCIPLISVPVIMLSPEENRGLIAVTCKVVITSCIYLYPLIIIVKQKKPLYNKEYWLFALKFNLPLLPHFLSVILLQQCDRLLIDRFCGKAEVAMYSVAFSISTIMALINTAILNSYTPWTYQSMERKEYSRINKISKSLCVLVASVNLLVVFVAPDIIRILAPIEYSDGMYVMVPLIVSVYFMFSVNLFVNMEYYYAKVGFVTIGSIAAVIVNIVLNIVFIPSYGFVAAGYTTLVSYFVYSFGHYCMAKQLMKKMKNNISTVYDARIVFGVGLILIVVSILCSYLYRYNLVRYSFIAVLVILMFVYRKSILKLVKEIRN